MTFVDKWFPVWFTLPFLFATLDVEVVQSVATAARWGVLFAAAFFAFYSGFRRGRGAAARWLSADSMAVVWIGVLALSYFWSIEPVYSFQRAVSMGLIYVVAFWYVWDWVDRRSDDRFITRALWTIAVVLAANLLVGGAFAPSTVLAARFQGFFLNPNNIGLIAVLAVPLSFSRMLCSRRWIDCGLWGIFVISVITCGSRTALVASVAAMGVIIGVRFIKNMKAAMGVLLVLTLGIAGLSRTQFFEERVLRKKTLETMSNRTFFWDLARERYIPRRPRLGHGFGSDRDIHEYYGVQLSSLQLRGYGVMSSYYGLAVAMGVPFTVFFFSVLWGIPIRNLLKFHGDGRLILYSSVVISGLLVCITESSIYSAGNPFAYFFWIVVMLMVRRSCYRKYGIRQTRGGALKRVPVKRRLKGAQSLRNRHNKYA